MVFADLLPADEFLGFGPVVAKAYGCQEFAATDVRRPRAQLSFVRMNCKRGTVGQAIGEAPTGVEPAFAVLQTAAWPSGSGTRCCPVPGGAMSSPGIEPGPRPSRGRVRGPSHPEDDDPHRNACESPTGNRPGLVASKAAVRPTPAGKHPVPLPGVEPGLRPSEGRVRSDTRQGHTQMIPLIHGRVCKTWASFESTNNLTTTAK